MSKLKKLASQTAIYGLSTLLVRLINYGLAPIQTRVIENQADFGIISIIYAYVAFLNVVFMYGMETSFFRYASNSDDKPYIFKTANSMLILTTILFTGLMILFANPLAAFIHYPDHPEYVILFSLIIAFDTLVNIPFAKLRLDSKPLQYLSYKLLNVLTNFSLNILFLAPAFLKDYTLFESFGFVYHPENVVLYVFTANLAASIITFLVFVPMIVRTGFGIDKPLLKQLWRYGSPLIIVGFAGIINEVIDRIMLSNYLPGSAKEVAAKVGVYSACYKIAIFMNLAVQAFRMGAEPFFFSQSKEKDAKQTYADVMLYFSIFTLIIFLVVSLNLNYFGWIIGKNFRSGIYIVPYLLVAYFLLGIFYNLSTWYKVTDNTRYATYISIFGAICTIVSTYLLIPRFDILAGALGTIVGYGSMSLASYFAGQRIYKIPYDVKKIGFYFILSLSLYLFSHYFITPFISNSILLIILNAGLLFVFLMTAFMLDIKNLLKKNSHV